MLAYVIRRVMYMVVVVLVLSVVAFTIIELPPGNYVTSYIATLRLTGASIDEEQIIAIEKQFGLDLPIYLRYFNWMWNIAHGNFGISFRWNMPVKDLLAERLPLTVMISLLTLVFTFGVGVPIGIYSALRQYSVGDYVSTFLGFIGLAIPNFLLALILMLIFYKYFGWNPVGLFSPHYKIADWSVPKLLDMCKHLPIPIVVIGTAGTASVIRIMRGCLLDELEKQYVVTARSKGMKETNLIFKYPVRLAINPIVSTIGWQLSAIVSGSIITAIVLDLPTTGPLLYDALKSQDTYLAGSIVLILSFLTVVGTFVSDMLLNLLDPRIQYEKSI